MNDKELDGELKSLALEIELAREQMQGLQDKILEQREQLVRLKTENAKVYEWETELLQELEQRAYDRRHKR